MHLLIVYYSSQKLSPKASSDTILDQITRKRFKVALTRIGLIGKSCSQKKYRIVLVTERTRRSDQCSW